MQELSEGGEAGQYSPGVSAALTQIVPYLASLYTVFHSVIYNSVIETNFPCLYNCCLLHTAVAVCLYNCMLGAHSTVIQTGKKRLN